MAYDKERSASRNGTGFNPKVVATKPSEQFTVIHKKKDVDVYSSNIIQYAGMGRQYHVFQPTTHRAIDKKHVNQTVYDQLNKIGFFSLAQQSPTGSPALTQQVFKMQTPASGQQTSTVDALVQGWTRFKHLKSNQQGSLFMFDLETYGANTKDLRWNPMGITEFAMIEYDFATKQRHETNILFTNDNVINDLKTFRSKYLTAMNSGRGVQAVLDDEELRVTAMRMGVYDPERGARFVFNEATKVWEATSLGSTEGALIGNVDSVLRGVDNLIYLNSQLEDKGAKLNPVTGLPYDQEAYIKAMGKMSYGMYSKQAVISGHNIGYFDRPIADRNVRMIYEQQKAILANPNATAQQIKQATAAIDLFHSSFGVAQGNQVGFVFGIGDAVDTLDASKIARDILDVRMPNAKLETLADLFYPNRPAGVSHLGINDVRNNMAMFLDTAEGTGGLPYMHYIMEAKNKGGITGYNVMNPATAMEANQLYKVTGSLSGSRYSKRGFLDNKVYANGDIFLNGDYRIHSGGSAQHNEMLGGATFNSNMFYVPIAQQTIDLNQLDPKVRQQVYSAYTDISGDKLYHAAFQSYDPYNTTDKHIVNIYAATQEELESKLGGVLSHVANINTDGTYSVVDHNMKHLSMGAIIGGQPGNFQPYEVSSETELVQKALQLTSDKRINDAVNRSVFSGDKSMKRIHGLLNFDTEARKKGLKKGLDAILNDGVSLAQILTNQTGTINGVQYFTDKEVGQLNEMFTRHLGWYNKKTGKQEIDFRTVTNVSNAYNAVMDQKDYYRNVIEAVRLNKGVKKGDLKNKYDSLNAYFLHLDRQMRAAAGMDLGLDDENIKRAVKQTTGSAVNSIAYYQNRYEFQLGKQFTVLGPVTPVAKDVFGHASPEDLVTFDLHRKGGVTTFADQLYKKHMGEGKKGVDQNKELNTANAVWNFLIDVGYNQEQHKDLFKHKEFSDHVNKLIHYKDDLGMFPDDFDPIQSLEMLRSAIEGAKKHDVTAGILSAGEDLKVIRPDKIITDKLNGYSYKEIYDKTSNFHRVIEYDRNNKQQMKLQVQDLVNRYGISESDYKKAIKGMTEAEQKSLALKRKIVNTQLESHFEDLLSLSEFGFNLAVDTVDNTPLLIGKGGKVQVLDKMPRFSIDERTGGLVMKSGRETVLVELATEVHEAANGMKLGHVTTNIDSSFGKPKYYYNLMKGAADRGEPLSAAVVNKHIGYRNKESREHTKLSGRKGDFYIVNQRMDLSGVDELYYDLFRLNSQYQHLADDIDFIGKDTLRTLRKNVESFNTENILDKNGAPPDMKMLATNDIYEITKALMDPNHPYYDDFMELMKYAGPSSKETVWSKGIVQLGEGVVDNALNLVDNLQRPPVAGAGNIKYLKIDDILKLKGLGVDAASGFHDSRTIKAVYQSAFGIDFISDFSANQLYISGPMTKKLVHSKKNDMIKANINNYTLSQMTEAAKSKLYDFVGESIVSSTFEQGRYLDARIANQLIPNNPIDRQWLRFSKDIQGAFNDTTNQSEVARLIEVMGEITQRDDGTFAYNKRQGTIVKKGEIVATMAGYGGVKDYFGSNFRQGVLSYEAAIEGHNLTTSQIEQLINKNAKRFEGLETNAERLGVLTDLLDELGVEHGYKIENLNRASYIKILDSGVEKGMSDTGNLALGQYNLFNREYFRKLTKMANGPVRDKYDVVFQTVPTDQAIIAMHEDIAKMKGMTVDELVTNITGRMKNNAGVTNMSGLLEMVKDEREAAAHMFFGKGAALEGYFAIANDGISGHGNIGLALQGSFGAAANKYAKAANISYADAVNRIVHDMSTNDDINFFRQTTNGRHDGDTRVNLTANIHGTVMMNIPQGESYSIDREKYGAFMNYVNDLIVELDADTPEDDKLVHTNVYVYDEKNKTLKKETALVGSYKFIEEIGPDGEVMKIALGADNKTTHAIIADSETQSGITQEFIDAKRGVASLQAKVRSGKPLTDEDRQNLQEWQTIVRAEKNSVKYSTIDDQGFAILNRTVFNDDMAEDLNAALRMKDGTERNFSPQKAALLAKKTGDLVKYDLTSGRMSFDESIKDMRMYQGYVEEMMAKQYYNPIHGEELTPAMLKNPQYSHLQEVYDAVKDQGVDKLGAYEAQQLYNLKGMSLAADFNMGSPYDAGARAQELIDKEKFELKTLSEYVPTMGYSGEGPVQSIAEKRIMLDLGADMDPGKRYVAIPAGGKQIGDMEVLKAYQTEMRNMKRIDDDIKALEGSGMFGGYSLETWNSLPKEMQDNIIKQSNVNEDTIKDYQALLAQKLESREKIVEFTNRYPRKGTDYTKMTKVDITEASVRLKIASFTSPKANAELLKELGFDAAIDEGSESFLKNAKVLMGDGSSMSLFDMEQQGFSYGFARANEQIFRDLGYFNPETIKEYGFKNEGEMRQYLQEYGTLRMSTRYPQIMKTSIGANRLYLDNTVQGNQISVSNAFMLSYLGDKDGDSESGHNIVIRGINAGRYERARMMAVQDLQKAGNTNVGAQLTADIREQVISKYGIDANTYDEFTAMYAGLDIQAAYFNDKWRQNEIKTLRDDMTKNLQVGDVGSIISQFKGVSQTFGQTKYAAKRIMPSTDEIKQNLADVQDAMKLALQSNELLSKQVLTGETLEVAQQIADGKITMADIRGTMKYDVLDKAMAALEQDPNLEGTDVFKTAKNAMVQRALNHQLFEEASSKATKTAIGTVNNMFNSLKIASSGIMGNPNNPLYNLNQDLITFESLYQAEQAIISGKKQAFEASDTRIMDLGNLMQKIMKGETGEENRKELAVMLGQYGGEKAINAAWYDMRSSMREQLEKPGGILENMMNAERVLNPTLSEDDLRTKARALYIANEIVEDIVKIQGSDIGQAAIRDAKANKAGSTHKALNRTTAPGPNTMLGPRVQNVIHGNTASQVDDATQRAMQGAIEYLTSDALEQAEQFERRSASNVPNALLKAPQVASSTAIGMAALGVAAGLMVAGYAGGGHSRPAPAQDDSSQSQAPVMLDEAQDPDSGIQQHGYVININADSRKGARNIKRTLKEIGQAQGGNVSINMNYRTTKGGGYSNKDIENIINNFI